MVQFAGDDLWLRDDDTDTAVDKLYEELTDRTRIHIHLEEPVAGEYDEPLYQTRITYRSGTEDGYFQVSTDRYHPTVDADQADRWVAGVERALLDADLPVKLGDITHEDNDPVTSDRFYSDPSE